MFPSKEINSPLNLPWMISQRSWRIWLQATRLTRMSSNRLRALSPHVRCAQGELGNPPVSLYILIRRAVINISADYARTCSGPEPFFLLSTQINTRINLTVASGVYKYTREYIGKCRFRRVQRRIHLFSGAESLLRTSRPLSYAWNALRWTCKLPPHIPPRRPLLRQTMQIRKQAGKKLRRRLLLLAGAFRCDVSCGRCHWRVTPPPGSLSLHLWLGWSLNLAV
jgi:hypothetical protein